MELNINKKKQLVDKYLKANKMNPIFDIYLENIDNISMYIVISYQLKDKTYRVSWIDLTAMENEKVSYWFNSNLIFPEKAEKFKNIIASNEKVEQYKDLDKIDSMVIMNSFITNYEPSVRTFEFKRYIPKCWSFLSNAIYILFDNMPRFCFSFYQIMIEKLLTPEVNYIFYHDKEEDDVDTFFSNDIKKIGSKIYNDGFVKNLEKVNNTYYGIIKDDKEYLTEIIYNDDVKEMQMLCTCGSKNFCKHLYATTLAMKDKREMKFYKIAYKDENKSLLDRIRNFEYFLCLGISDNYFIVIQNNSLVALPILDKEHKLNWKIIEDDDVKTLEKQLRQYIKDNI